MKVLNNFYGFCECKSVVICMPSICLSSHAHAYVTFPIMHNNYRFKHVGLLWKCLDLTQLVMYMEQHVMGKTTWISMMGRSGTCIIFSECNKWGFPPTTVFCSASENSAPNLASHCLCRKNCSTQSVVEKEHFISFPSLVKRQVLHAVPIVYGCYL